MISIITPTWERPQLLVHCILAVKRQSVGVEHIVVSDGPDERAQALCRHYGVRYAHCPEHAGDFGNTARDIGVGMASGDHLAFWDDDNFFVNEAASRLGEAVADHDIGVVRIRHWHRQKNFMRTIPEAWDGQFYGFHIDTACFCVRRDFFIAHGLKWRTATENPYSADHQLCERMRQLGARINFSSVVIGTHI